MTDNEIIKALEHCRDNGCAGCPLEFMEDDKGCMTEWLALINRQRAEIERLEELVCSAENETANVRDLYFEEKRERAEAIKELLTEAKKQTYVSSDWSHGEHPLVIEWDDLEEVAEEMVGADND